MARKLKQVFGGGSDLRGVDLVEVERLLSFMEKHGLEEFEYEAAGVHIRLKKPSASGPRAMTEPTVSPVAPVSAPTQVTSPAAAAAGHGAESGRAADLHLIKSPIVGTFYAAPSPGADPFVARGVRVEAGQVLCIIEAMKLMNEIESDVSGEVAEIYAENGSPVEYGQPLYGIRVQAKK
jgi:acetyl-CoA carboxylase biotin carboxyl carrier protein